MKQPRAYTIDLEKLDDLEVAKDIIAAAMPIVSEGTEAYDYLEPYLHDTPLPIPQSDE